MAAESQQKEISLATPISALPGVGSYYLKGLKRLGIENLEDLLFHFPHRYDDFSSVSSIAQINSPGKFTVQGRIMDIRNRRTPRKRMVITEALVSDKTGSIRVVWFNQPFLTKNLPKGSFVSLSGRVVAAENWLVFSSPSYELIKEQASKAIHTGRLVPVYPETQGISSRWLRYKISVYLPLAKRIRDFLPEEILKSEGFPGLSQALLDIHFPKTEKAAKLARQRLVFEQMFLSQLKILFQRIARRREKAFAIPFSKTRIQEFVKSLPFELTRSQRIASWEIIKDLGRPWPMNRLLEGDVGTGKTLVALIASFQVVLRRKQVAIMVPTEILASQHFEYFKHYLKNYKVAVALLTSSRAVVFSAGREKQLSVQKLLELAKEAKVDIVIGTHSLIQDKIEFPRLALVVVDEQHRFGVKQRATLVYKKGSGGYSPHLLSMTATPIPRSLALTVYGNLDISILKEFPKGRRRVLTKVVPPARKKAAYEFVAEKLREGHQAFVICPLIEESEKLETRAVLEEYRKLSGEIFPDFKVSFLHGRMNSKDKLKIMEDFARGKIDILISTTVVEVGVDIPGASIMLIEGAERFGLAQLHQLRGRVGRNNQKAFCFLFTDSSAKATRMRLKALTEETEGLKLAERDLEIRGPGEFLGIRQSGRADIVMENLSNLNLVKKARNWAKWILEKDPDLTGHRLLKARLDNYKKNVHLD